jgi:hypothetical protein
MHVVSRREFLVLIGKGVAVTTVPNGALVASEPVEKINWLGTATELLSRTGEAKHIAHFEVRPTASGDFTNCSQEVSRWHRLFRTCGRIVQIAWKLATGQLRDRALYRASRLRLRALGHHAATVGAPHPHRLRSDGKFDAALAVRPRVRVANAICSLLHMGDRVRVRPANRPSRLNRQRDAIGAFQTCVRR